ncbi:MAG: hypothetical protein U5L03_05910, partial [Burkholderiaceae bacterium]|nr:hypothetical protein [Burkholderiaceae bacterium]
ESRAVRDRAEDGGLFAARACRQPRPGQGPAPRAQSLYVMTQRDWLAARGTTASAAPATLGGYTTPKLELSLL